MITIETATAEIAPSELPRPKANISFGSMYADIAKIGFGLDLSGPPDLAAEATHTTSAISVLDKILDIGKDPTLHEKALGAIAANDTEVLPLALARYADDFASWNSDKQAVHMESHRTIQEVAQKKRRTTSVDDLCELLTQEGEATGRLYRVYDTREKVRLFNDFLEHCGIGTLAVDTFFDLGKDFENGVTEVLPTIKNRLAVARLGRSAAHEAWDTIPNGTAWAGAVLVIPSIISGVKVIFDLNRDKRDPTTEEQHLKQALAFAS